MSKFFVIFLSLFFLNKFAIAYVIDYVPQVDEVKKINIENIQSINKKTKFAQNLNDSTRGSIGAKIYKKVAPITVLVETDRGYGSGFVIDKEGHVVTNYHNIQIDYTKRNEYEVSVELKFCPVDGEEIRNQIVYNADVVKIDPNRDLALLKLRSTSGLDNFSPAKLDYSENVLIGMDVHAIGHPEGNPCTYTRGVISQIRKSYRWDYDAYNSHTATVIQTQTPINPGNSGGPLISDDGLIIGINSFKQPDTEGIAFAVASIEIQNFLDMDNTVNENKSDWITKSESSWITKKKNKNLDKCDYDIPIKEEDFNDNGILDLFHYDTDCNNIAETFAYDEDEDGSIDIMLIDSNESGTPNVTLEYDFNDDGDQFARYYYDDNEDGNFDAVCYDINLDNEIDECRELT
ncbi:serine protease [Pelagibacteraceae bacterium]|nr:serine protease [Pelagibacteraceae bacterium]